MHHKIVRTCNKLIRAIKYATRVFKVQENDQFYTLCTDPATTQHPQCANSQFPNPKISGVYSVLHARVYNVGLDFRPDTPSHGQT